MRTPQVLLKSHLIHQQYSQFATCPHVSYHDINTILGKLKAVTAEQLRDVTKKYFNDDSLTVAVLDPQPIEQKLPVKASSGLNPLDGWNL